MHPYINIFNLKLQSYWVLMVIAFIVGVITSSLEAKRKSQDILKVIIIAFLIALSGWIGARIGYFILHNPIILIKKPLKIFIFWRGGLAAYGGIFTASIAGLFLAKVFHLKRWKLADTYVLGASIAQGIGRIGCFLNGCCYGKQTNVIWNVVYTNPESIAPIMVPLHPTQLYEAIANFLMFGLLLYLRKRFKKEGYLFLSYLIIYSLIRSIVAPFRFESLPLIDGIVYLTHLVTLITLIICFFLYIYLRKH